jgi:hypothetical protein
MLCCNTNSFYPSHIETFHILLKSSTKTLIMRPIEPNVGRFQIAEMRHIAVQSQRVSAFGARIHRSECPEVADSRLPE